MSSSPRRIPECIQVACLLEATARKAGNVHPDAAFDDLHYDDFVNAARIIAPLLAESRRVSVGQAILAAVSATNSCTRSNANLGIVLLIAPLASVQESISLDEGVSDVLNRLTVDDASLVYQAIRLARPGGLGEAAEEDVTNEPQVTLKAAMELAADRDLIARQYAEDYRDILGVAVPILVETWNASPAWEQAVLNLQLELLARFPDSLIARKCGSTTAADASRRAKSVLSQSSDKERQNAYRQFDLWLRADRNRRNPGTTADLIAATLFVALRERLIDPPICLLPDQQ